MTPRQIFAHVLRVGLAVSLAGSVRCSAAPAPSATCTYRVVSSGIAQSSRVELVGDFNNWARPGPLLRPTADGRGKSYTLELSPGPQRYALVVDGEWRTDDYVGTSSYFNGREVTRIVVGECRKPELVVESVVVSGGVGRVVLRAERAPTLAVADLQIRGALAESAQISVQGTRATIELSPLAPGKSVIEVGYQVAPTNVPGDLPQQASRTITLWNAGVQSPSVPAWEPRDALVYQVVLDRYRNARGALAAPASPAGRAGGSLQGLRAQIEAGAFTELGVDTLWLSPLNRTPEGTFAGNDERQYAGYHGYWPAAARELDPQLGTEADLEQLMQSAHARGLRVLLDVVPNHVHAQHPYVAAHPDWFTGKPGACTCGQGACSWAANLDTCWFAPYLPNVNWENDAAAAAFSADVAYWVGRYGADGVRIDAVPMMPRAASRRIAQQLRALYQHPGNPLWLVGENFVGPTSYERLAYHLGPFGLDTQFHFPLLWAVRRVVGRGVGGMQEIAESFAKGEATWGGSGAVMGLTAGNHDVARLASVISGEDDGQSGWTPAARELDAEGAKRQALAIGLTYALPGAPFLYYGDELGLVGRNDPDARRVMPELSQQSVQARALYTQIARLGRLRRCSAALRRGAYREVFADAEHLMFLRESAAGAALVVATRNPSAAARPTVLPATLRTGLSGLATGTWADAMSGAQFTLAAPGASALLPTPAQTLAVYLPAGDPCAAGP